MRWLLVIINFFTPLGFPVKFWGEVPTRELTLLANESLIRSSIDAIILFAIIAFCFSSRDFCNSFILF